MKKLIIALAAVSMLGACGQIDEGQRGIFKYYGQMEQKSYSPGFYWYNPWSTDMETMDVRQQKVEVDTVSYTKDAQQAGIKATVTFHVNPSQAHTLYSTIGTDWAEKIVPQLVTEIVKNEFGKYNAMAIISNRGQVAELVTIQVRDALKRRHIILDSFELMNVDYSDAFENAVEAKEVAVQDAIREKNKTVAVQERATQAVITAKGEAEAMGVRAQALAQTPRLVEYEAVQKWDGKLPQCQLGGATPFINVK